MVTTLSIVWPVCQLFWIAFRIFLAPSGASRYLHTVPSSNTAVTGAALQCDLGSKGAQRGSGRVGGVRPVTGGVGEAVGDTGSGGPRGSGCSHGGREATGQPERRTRVLMQRSTGRGEAMSSTFPLQVSLYLAHKRPQWLLLTSPCPHPSSSSPGMTSARLTHMAPQAGLAATVTTKHRAWLFLRIKRKVWWDWIILCCKKYINAILDSAARMNLVAGTELSPHCKRASADLIGGNGVARACTRVEYDLKRLLLLIMCSDRVWWDHIPEAHMTYIQHFLKKRKNCSVVVL